VSAGPHARDGRAAFATTALDAAGIPLFAATILEPGEVIIGTWRPSPLWIALRSSRWSAFAMLVAAIAAAASGASGLSWAIPIGQAAVGAVLVRLAVAVAEWASRVYVLTDRRVLRRRGLVSPTVYSANLNALRRIELVRTRTDRALGTGSITFLAGPGPGYDAAWIMLARPAEVLALVESTRRRYGR